MRDYIVKLNQNGQAVVDVVGNFISLIEVSAKSERYRVEAETENGEQVCALNMREGGFAKNLPQRFNKIRITNENQGNGEVKIIAGMGEYEEGGSSGGGATVNSLENAVVATAIQNDDIIVIPANDSRKRIHIQTGEFNTGVVLINGGYEMLEAEDVTFDVKSEIRLTIKNTGDHISYMEEV